jgi:hypothetical protein
MSWISAAWDWYAKPENREALKPILTLSGSLIVGVGTIIVGGLVATSGTALGRNGDRAGQDGHRTRANRKSSGRYRQLPA